MTGRETCFYCDKPVAADQVERDHAPIPQRVGGTETVPACIACHDLKDRLPLEQWGEVLMVEALRQCGPLGRIFLARAFATSLDREALAATP